MAFSAANPSPSAARSIARAKAAAGLRTARDLSAVARLVGLEFLARADKRGMCSAVSIASLAEAVNSCERHVRRCIAQLAERGFLIVTKKNHHQPDDYMLLVNKLAALGEAVTAQVQAVCTVAARAAAAARAHVRAKGLGILEAAREARRAAHDAAREARDRLRASSPPPVLKTPDNGPRQNSDRTFCPRIPSRYVENIPIVGKVLNLASPRGFWKAPGTPQGQVLTSQQLDRKAHARVSEALRSYGYDALLQFQNHPDAASIEADAIKAERFNPNSGRTGLAVIIARMNGVTT